MKFGKTLAKRQLDIPEYAASFVNYKALKKLIKSLAAASRINSVQAAASAGSVSNGRALGETQTTLQANKATFFFRLDREIEKVNAFYLQKEAELKLRLRTLVDKKSIIQGRSDATSKISTIYLTLQEGFQQFQNDLSKLQKFVELNATAFSKILKKWDKSSKSRTKELYLSRAVEIQPCFNRDVITELSDQATTSLLELEGWAEGENIIFDQKPASQTLGEPDDGDADADFLRAVFAENTTVLKEWISRLQHTPSAQDRITRVFLAAIPEASDRSLNTLIETGLINFQAEDEINERTCLHEAAISGKSYVLRIGIQNGLDISRPDVYGRIPLHYASMHGRLEMIQMLVECGPATINTMDHDNFTPLIHAINHNQPQCVKQLIASDARIDPIGDQDYAPLNLACQRGFCEVTEILLSHRPRIIADAEGLYPQHLVARAGHSSKLLQMLKGYGVDLNEPDRLFQWTAVFHAASEGHVECLKGLLDLGARVDAIDEKGLSAMYYAAWEGHLACMQLLSAAGGGLGLQVIKPQRTSPASGHSGYQMTDSDGIPDLSLPPPIIPLRRYGHNFLHKKTLVQLTFEDRGDASVSFFHESKYPAARLTISSKSSDIIPRNVLLPLTEDNRTLSFQITDLDSFMLDFDIYPAFGTKIIARTVALPNNFTTTDVGRNILPLFDSRLRAIGKISYDIQIIKSFPGIPLEITHFATYWKATSQFDSHPSAFITGSSLSGEYVRLFVQLTSDLVPVVYPQWTVNVIGIDVPISSITTSQFNSIGLSFGSQEMRQKLTSVRSHADAHELLTNSFITLEEALSLLPHYIHVELNIHYPKISESHSPSKYDLNSCVDSILGTVFEHSRTLRQIALGASRAIVLSSYNTNICTALNWKQPNYPVFYCNDLGVEHKSAIDGSTIPPRSSISIKEAVRFASSNNLMGIICSSRLLTMVPALKQSVKEAGLVLVAEISDQESASAAAPTGVDGILQPGGVIKFEETIDM